MSVHDRSAEQVGEFIATVPFARPENIVDAQVALLARATKSLVWTSDPGDVERYAVPAHFVRRL